MLKKKYDEKCDIWSCGVILYILLCGFPPFNGENDKEIMERVAKGSYSFDFDEWKQISSEAKQFIKRMLEYDPNKRYNAEQAISDPWIKKYSGKSSVDAPIMENALKNMTNFRVFYWILIVFWPHLISISKATQKLQEATWMFLVNYLTTKEEKAELLKTFQALDLNCDGQLSREELIIGKQTS